MAGTPRGLRVSVGVRTAAAAIVAGVVLAVGAAPALAQGGGQPETFQVVRTIQTGSKPGPVIYAYGHAWVLSIGDGRLWQINPDTGAARGIKVAASAKDLAAGFNRIWVLSANRRRATIEIFSPTNALKGRIKHDFRAGSRFNPGTANIIKTGAGRVWVAGVMSASRLLEVDPRNRRTTLRRWPTPAAFAVEKGSLWTLTQNGSSNFLQRRSPRSLRVTKRVNVFNAVGGETAEAWLSYAAGLFYISYVEPNDVGEIDAVSPASGVVKGASYESDIALNCTAASASGVWAAKGFDGLGGAPASVTRLAPRTLNQLATESRSRPARGTATSTALRSAGASSG